MSRGADGFLSYSVNLECGANASPYAVGTWIYFPIGKAQEA
jgi:hypothetical protein